MTDNGYEATLTSFLDFMDSADFAGALALFAEDATYVRPVPNQPGSPLGTEMVTYHRKAEIGDFMSKRGHRDMRQRVVVSAPRGRHLFAEGVIEFGDGSPSVIPLFHLVFNDTGLIGRFMAVR
jgi:hypothetical protein